MADSTHETSTGPAGSTNAATANDTSSYVYPVPYVATLSAVLVAEMLAGVLSNLAVLVSYHVDRRFIRSVSDVFIINMNAVDLLICLVSIPATLTAVLSSPSVPLFCFFHEATVSFASVASAVNVAVISLDRHDKIAHPLVRRFNMRNVRWILPLVWLLSLLGFCSPLFGIDLERFGQIQRRYRREPNHCFHWFFSSRDNHLYELYYIPIFFAATFVMIYAYYGILRITRVKTIHSALVKATVSLKVDSGRPAGARAAPIIHNNNNNLRDPERRVSRTTTLIILTFITCWGPHALISIVIVAHGEVGAGDLALDVLERWLVALGYTTTLMHPILYVFMRRNFRRALASSWLGRCAARHGLVAPGSTPVSPARNHEDGGRPHRRAGRAGRGREGGGGGGRGEAATRGHPRGDQAAAAAAATLEGQTGRQANTAAPFTPVVKLDEDARCCHQHRPSVGAAVDEGDVQIAPSPELVGDSALLVHDAGHQREQQQQQQQQQGAVNPCALYVTAQSSAPAAEPTTSMHAFNEDALITQRHAPSTRGQAKNVTLPNVD